MDAQGTRHPTCQAPPDPAQPDGAVRVPIVARAIVAPKGGAGRRALHAHRRGGRRARSSWRGLVNEYIPPTAELRLRRRILLRRRRHRRRRRRRPASGHRARPRRRVGWRARRGRRDIAAVASEALARWDAVARPWPQRDAGAGRAQEERDVQEALRASKADALLARSARSNAPPRPRRAARVVRRTRRASTRR